MDRMPSGHKRKTAVFLIHPRDHHDLAATVWWSRFIPPFLTDPIMTRLSGRWGYVVCEKQSIFDKLDFYVLGIALKGRQMFPQSAHDLKRIRGRILEAVRFAEEELKADIIGLGALTASMTDGGNWLLKQKLGCRITHGNTYATLIAEEGIKKIVAMKGLHDPLIAVVGAYGIIGRALCRLLSRRYRLVVMGRNKVALERLKRELTGRVSATTELEGIRDADIVITATSHPEALMKPEHLKRGAVVYDLSQPANVGKELLKVRTDLIRIDGSLISTPGIVIRFDPATGQDETYACLGETILTALEGIERDVVGEIDLVYLERLREIGRGRGFTHADFTSFGRSLSLSRLSKTLPATINS